MKGGGEGGGAQRTSSSSVAVGRCVGSFFKHVWTKATKAREWRSGRLNVGGSRLWIKNRAWVAQASTPTPAAQQGHTLRGPHTSAGGGVSR
jgi:hypothetical protein